MSFSEHGWVPNGLPPKIPVQWSIVTQTGQLRVGTTERQVFSIDTRGWDKMGIRATATGLAAGDNVTIDIQSPEGGTYQSISAVATGTGSNQAAHTVTADILDIQAPRYALSAILASSAGTTEANLTLSVFLKGGSYG